MFIVSTKNKLCVHKIPDVLVLCLYEITQAYLLCDNDVNHLPFLYGQMKAQAMQCIGNCHKISMKENGTVRKIPFKLCPGMSHRIMKQAVMY